MVRSAAITRGEVGVKELLENFLAGAVLENMQGKVPEPMLTDAWIACCNCLAFEHGMGWDALLRALKENAQWRQVRKFSRIIEALSMDRERRLVDMLTRPASWGTLPTDVN